MARSQSNVGFLKLPAELRNDIYERVLDGATAEQQHHATSCPEQQDWLITYRSLLFLNRQVNTEIESLLGSAYAEKLTFYFNDASKLCDFVKQWQSHPLVSRARFDLRWRKNEEASNRADILRNIDRTTLRVLESAASHNDEVLEVLSDKAFHCNYLERPNDFADSYPFKWHPTFKVKNAFDCFATGTTDEPCMEVRVKEEAPGLSLAAYTWYDTSEPPIYGKIERRIQGYLSVTGRISEFAPFPNWWNASRGDAKLWVSEYDC